MSLILAALTTSATVGAAFWLFSGAVVVLGVLALYEFLGRR